MISLEVALGFRADDLQREFFKPHWNEIVIGRRDLADALTPALAKIAQHVSYEDFISYWFENDSRLNTQLLEELNHWREKRYQGLSRRTKSTSGWLNPGRE